MAMGRWNTVARVTDMANDASRNSALWIKPWQRLDALIKGKGTDGFPYKCPLSVAVRYG